MGYNCSVPQCNSKWTKENKGVMLHVFPKNKCRKATWKVKIRSGKEPTIHSRVCSLHFTREDYITTSMGQWKILKNDAVPSRNLPVRLHDAPPKSTRPIRLRKGTKATAVHSTDQVNLTDPAVPEDLGLHDEQSVHSLTIGGTCEIANESSNTLDGTTSDKQPDVQHSMQVTVSTQTSTMMYQTHYVKFTNLSEPELKYFSGFSENRFEVLFTFVGLCEGNIYSDITTAISPRDQLLLTLCKYRHNLDYKMLAFLFRITPAQASRVFNMCTDLVYKALKSVNFWSLGDQSADKYRVIIDCTEIPIDKSENPVIHQLTFSQYKNRLTFKSLVGIDEQGMIIYCSDIYGGSTSDRQIVILSKFVDLLKEGETVLADRGFEISDLLESKKVALNIPPFLRGKKQLSEHDAMKTRKLANRRIHVERLIGLSKINNIFKRTNGIIFMADCK